MATGADATVYVGSPVTVVPFLVAAEHGGLGDKMVVLAPSPVYNPAIPKAIGPYWNDKLYVNLEFGPLDATGPDTRNYFEVMKAFGGPIDPFSQMGYLAARAAVDALLKADPAKLDRAGVTAAIQKEQVFKSDMLCADWSFGAPDDTHRLSNRAGWMAVMHDNAWQVKAGCTEIDPRVIK
jgi:branched-chain amino acid transport system substrate-binding protein